MNRVTDGGLALIIALGGAFLHGAPPARATVSHGDGAGAGEAYSEFILGKISRFEGELGAAADHLSQAAGADDSAAIRVELAETYLRMGDLDKAIEQARLATAKSPESVDARRTLAEAYLASALRGPDRVGPTALAIVEYRSLVRLNPADHDARLMLGRLLLQEDRTEEALEQLRTVRSSGADPVQTGLLIARALLRADRREEADVELRSVLAVNPRSFEAHTLMAQIAEAREDWRTASDHYRGLVALRPADEALRTRLGYALLRAGRSREAVETLRESVRRSPTDRFARELLAQALAASGRPGEALHELSVLLEYRPADPSLLVEIGRLHEGRSENDAALDAYRRAIAASDKAGQDGLAPDLANGLVLSVAALEIDGGDPLSAVRTLSRISDDSSAIAFEAGVLRARALVAGGRAAGEGLNAARALTDKDPQNPRGALTLLEARLAADPRGDGAVEALAEFRPAARPFREVAAAAELLRKAGHATLALATLKPVLKIHATDPPAHFAMGALLERIGNRRESERYMQRVIELDPKHAQALNFLGYSLAERGRRLDLAESLIRRALEDDPDNGAYLDSLGWALLKQGRLAEAEKELSRAADIEAGDGTVREHLGDLHAHKGEMDRALAEWKAAQGMKPEDPKRLRRKILSALKAKGRQ